ncbi:MAG TPA: transglycosylase SLT domain-containing protein [Methylophilaceae bacterium]|nr:transglycosylase SLT domain-containing protein [Methylophilaceae bacterium]
MPALGYALRHWPGWLLACQVLLAPSVGFAATAAMLDKDDAAAIANEPPQIRQLLEKAIAFEHDERDWQGEWKAAGLYCEASRLGSAEAQYRLGMLYAFGKGVPKDRGLGASLFSVAASQGHYEAQKMLETINYTTTQLPKCVQEAVLPEKGSYSFAAVGKGAGGIDHYIAQLPQNKRWIVDLVGTLSEWYQVDPKLVLSIITVESNFKLQAQSSKAAMGLMQLIPATADRFNVKNAFDATQNIKGGIAYLHWLLSYFRGDVPLAVAAYNAGERAVDRYKGIPPYRETRAYVQKVMGLYQHSTHPYDATVTDPSPIADKTPQ